MGVEERIQSLDLSLFDLVSTQTYPEDRASLLLLQRCVRQSGDYIYAEIGSHLGGTLQPHLVDSRCALIYSIDKRPVALPDEYSGEVYYPGNSTQRMLDGLREAFPESPVEKIHTFDSDARDLDPSQFSQPPDFCFIDAEHTDRAVVADFGFCFRVCKQDGVIAFHDANAIPAGLARIRQQLRKSGTRFQHFLLPRHVYVILLDGAIEKFGKEIQEASLDESPYMQQARRELLKSKVSRRFPWLRSAWRALNGKDRLR
jgi:Methyltransferase domain